MNAELNNELNCELIAQLKRNMQRNTLRERECDAGCDGKGHERRGRNEWHERAQSEMARAHAAAAILEMRSSFMMSAKNYALDHYARTVSETKCILYWFCPRFATG
ncbi:hypothetical protein [Paraburkholderia sp. DHOC27]|uniref:hypothetical protein n=1 Tax=Paraburkholderia sp. DHOC27 TaxID=2303330 RepID=UPI0011C13616|nr:hypothetical protein [Paraburkholderia sp. DHOC27]